MTIMMLNHLEVSVFWIRCHLSVICGMTCSLLLTGYAHHFYVFITSIWMRYNIALISLITLIHCDVTTHVEASCGQWSLWKRENDLLLRCNFFLGSIMTWLINVVHRHNTGLITFQISRPYIAYKVIVVEYRN